MRTTKTFLAVLILLFTASLQGLAANKKTTVEQVTATVTLSDKVDYIVTSTTPFGDNGVVNITNTDHAVLILSQVKPSVAAKLLSAHVQINGAKASNNSNCQVKLYNRGSIILPYGNNVKPLTVYSEQNFEGESCSDFGLENSGGYMNTLTDKQLNNRIRSFKLKRGYMVTFANRAGGRGYSRCFIAAYGDLEVAELPSVLDRSISSYRVFKWYDAGKSALANDTRAGAVKDLNVTSCYSFGLGENRLPDAECVPHHIYEDYPSSSACGGVTYSPHLKTNNEPGNSADDHPQSVETILNNWENLMRTGMRLCSPSSHDGSLGHLREFMDSIDARGWRCDIIDLHCYWPEWNFYNSIKGWVDSYHRPIWISEWVWGASWNNNGIFGEAQGDYRNNPTQAQLNKNRDVVRNICNALNGYDYVERYYYWNSEANCSKLRLDNGNLTPAGEMYAQLDGGLAYNGKYDYAPRTPKQKDPSDLIVEFDKDTHTATLTWHEYNGELNSDMSVQRRQSQTASWVVVSHLDLEEVESDYTFQDDGAVSGCQYRIHVVDAEGKSRYTKVVMAVSDEMGVGDGVDVSGTTMFLGGNMLVNGDFEMGAYGWTNGEGGALGQPWFQVVPVGGADGSAYLQAYGDGVEGTVSSAQQRVTLQKNTYYYFSGAACNTTSVLTKLLLRSSEDDTGKTIAFLSNQTNNWLTQFSTFNTEERPLAYMLLSKLGGTTQVDNLMLARLFDTEAEALADGLSTARQRGETFIAYNTLYPVLNSSLQQQMAAVPAEATKENVLQLETLVQTALKAYQLYPSLLKLEAHAKDLSALGLYGHEDLDAAIARVSAITTAAAVIEEYEQLQQAIDTYMPPYYLTDKISDSMLATGKGWTTKCGTYTGGDQRVNSKDGLTFWNAWWSGLSASEGKAKTMAIKQQVTGLSHGLYAVGCNAATEHYCLTDQHAYITNGEDTRLTPALTADYYDLPTVSHDDCWQNLVSAPVYVDDEGEVTIGFEGSKAGATDNAWHPWGSPNNNGDKREGWWCATDFYLQFHPLYKLTVEPNQWGVTCLPYAIRPSEGMKFYFIAAINPEYTLLYLREVDEVPAGMPCIYRSEKADVCFYEYGKATEFTEDAPGNIRGFLQTSSRVGRNHYYLTNGVWQKVDNDNRPTMTSYTGIIRPLDYEDNTPIPVVTSWSGPSMPIVGVTDEEKAANDAAIAESISTIDHSPLTIDHYYDLQGRKIVNSKSVNSKSVNRKSPRVLIINGKKIIQ